MLEVCFRGAFSLAWVGLGLLFAWYGHGFLALFLGLVGVTGFWNTEVRRHRRFFPVVGCILASLFAYSLYRNQVWRWKKHQVVIRAEKILSDQAYAKVTAEQSIDRAMQWERFSESDPAFRAHVDSYGGQLGCRSLTFSVGFNHSWRVKQVLDPDQGLLPEIQWLAVGDDAAVGQVVLDAFLRTARERPPSFFFE